MHRDEPGHTTAELHRQLKAQIVEAEARIRRAREIIRRAEAAILRSRTLLDSWPNHLASGSSSG
jgi:hypothetical protein